MPSNSYALALKRINDDEEPRITTVEGLALSSIKSGESNSVLPNKLNHHIFTATSLREVDLSDADLTDTRFGTGCYLYAINFSSQDLTSVTFDPKCSLRSFGTDKSVIKPFNLTGTKLTHHQLLQFIKCGVVDIKQINWDIQPDVVKANKQNYIALWQVMVASHEIGYRRNNRVFTFEALRSSFRIPRKGGNKAQVLINHCDLEATVSDSPCMIDIDHPGTQSYALVDIISTLERVRLHKDSTTTHPSSKYGERLIINGNTYIQRNLDRQQFNLDSIEKSSYIATLIRDIHFTKNISRFHKCTFNGTHIAPASIAQAPSTTQSSFLRFNRCDFSHRSKFVSHEGISSRLQFTQCTFDGVTLQGNFNSTDFDSPHVEINPTKSRHCTFSNSTLSGSFRGANFEKATIDACTLKGDFAHARFTDASITNCDLSNMVMSTKRNTFSKTNLTGCTVTKHAHVMHLLFIAKANISQLNWAEMNKQGLHIEPYMQLAALYNMSHRENVKQMAAFIHLLAPDQKHVLSMADIQEALRTEGTAHHTMWAPFHPGRNRYYQRLKTCDLSAPETEAKAAPAATA